MNREIKTRLQQRLGSERSGWIRSIDGGAAMSMPPVLAGALLPDKIEIITPPLRGAFYRGLLCVPIVACNLFRETSQTRIERSAIPGVVLRMSLAPIVAAVAAARLS